MNGFGSSGSAFGQSNNSAPFGASQQPQTGFGFGQTQPQQGQTQPPSTGFGFGAQPSANTSGTFGQAGNTSGFGNNNNTGGGIFGAANKPATGFGAGSANTSGTGLFGNNNANTSGFGSGFGANNNNNTNTAAPTGGIFGNTNTANNTGGGIFGNNNNQNAGSANTSGTGLFGSNNTNTGFGANNTATTGFGANNNNSANTSLGGGLFGNNNTQAPNGGATGGLFGNNSNTTNNAGGGGLFGNNNTNNTAPSGGLFGNNNNAPTAGGGLFGNNNNQQANQAQPSGGLFGNNNAQKPAGGGLFGNNSSTGGGLFGNNNTNSNSTFGNSQPQQSGGLFGGANNTNTGNTAGGLFNKPAAPTGGLFGSSTAPSTAPAPSTGGGLFGNSGGSLFNKPAQPAPQPATGSLFSTANTAQQQPQQLIARIDQPSYTLPKATRPQKLYTSLSVPTKRAASDEGDFSFVQGETPSLATEEFDISKFDLKPGLPSSSNTAVVRSLPEKGKTASLATATSQTNPRQWINSYDQFLRDRPTTLVIKSKSELPNGLPDIEIPGSVLSKEFVTENEEERRALDMINEPSVIDPNATQNPGDFSLFRRSAHDLKVVRVNKKAIDDGYYIKPDFKELASMSRDQISALPSLIIGRKGYGKIEYNGPIDLSTISNLGDILGELVIFNTGTVCVYPDLDNKRPVGTELNLPATITIENVWARDSATHKKITDAEDPRTAVLVNNLKQICAEKGAEFITYTHGLWIMKVPHFSVWGITPDQMCVELPEEENYMPEVQVPAEQNPNNLKFFHPVAFVKPQEDQMADEVEENAQKDNFFLNDNGLDIGNPSDVEIDDEYEAQEPQTWLEQLAVASNGVLQAEVESLRGASRGNPYVNIEEVLVPESEREAVTKANQTYSELPNSVKESRTYTSSDLEPVKYRKLLNYVKVTPRSSTDLPQLKSVISFKDLQLAQPAQQSLWSLLSTLYDNQLEDDKLKQWFSQKAETQADANNKSDVFEGILNSIAVHQVDSAIEKANKTNSLHLALLISLMATNSQAAVSSAKKQIEDWKSSFQIGKVPEPIRKVWEIASGDISSCLSWHWTSLVGCLIWYADLDLQTAMNKVVELKGPIDDPEFLILEFFLGSKTLSNVLDCLNLPNAFLFLQAYSRTQDILFKDLPNYDAICNKLSEVLEAIGDNYSALFTALHIDNAGIANKVCTGLLSQIPVSESIPPQFGFSEKFLNETKASQVEVVGEFYAQAEYLIRAEKYDAAHNVLISEIAPQGIIMQNLTDLTTILETLNANKQAIPEWNTGGGLYLAYYHALNGDSSKQTLSYLYNACCEALTPTLKAQYAVSEISNWLASQRTAWELYSVGAIMKMKFTASRKRTQAILQSSRLI